MPAKTCLFRGEGAISAFLSQSIKTRSRSQFFHRSGSGLASVVELIGIPRCAVDSGTAPMASVAECVHSNFTRVSFVQHTRLFPCQGPCACGSQAITRPRIAIPFQKLPSPV